MEYQNILRSCVPYNKAKGEKLFVDHDHSTNVVRSLLCPQCNFGLGSFSDNEEKLRKAASYVTDHRIKYQVDKLLDDAQNF